MTAIYPLVPLMHQHFEWNYKVGPPTVLTWLMKELDCREGAAPLLLPWV